MKRRTRIAGAALFILGILLVAGPLWLTHQNASFPTWSRNATTGIVVGPSVIAFGLWAIVTGHGKDPATGRMMSLTRPQTAVLFSVLLGGLMLGATLLAYFAMLWKPDQG